MLPLQLLIKLYIMKQLMQLRLFSLLSETSKKESSQTSLNEAYDEFVLKLFSKFKTATNLPELYYNLSYIRLELADICNQLSDGKGKKCF